MSTFQSRREEARQDRLIRAQIDLERDTARSQARTTERDAAARRKAEASAARAARLARLAEWAAAHVVDLLFVPVIGVPALLSWTAMAQFGARLYPGAGYLLPAFSEGAMWAFAAAVTLTLHRHPGQPVWHLRAGIAVFAAFGAALNFVHGLTVAPLPGLPSGTVTGAVMAAISVAGVIAHQLITAGPGQRTRPRTGPVPAAVPAPHPGPVPAAHPARTPARTRGAPAARTRAARRSGTPVTAESAETRFAADLAAGRVPSIRQIKAELRVGQDSARVIRDHLAAAVASPAPSETAP